MSKLLERIAKLEARSAKPGLIDIIRVIIAHDGSIKGGFRRGQNMELVPLTEHEIEALRRDREIAP